MTKWPPKVLTLLWALSLLLPLLLLGGGTASAQSLCPASTPIPCYTDPLGPPAYPTAWSEFAVPDPPPYSWGGDPIADPPGGPGGDPSTGGTNPSGYVDVVPGPGGAPSVYFNGNGTILFYEFILNGPPISLTGSGQPYNSATWTVLIDTVGDGFKNFAVMLSGIDSNPMPDDLIVMYNGLRTHSLNLTTDTLWRQDSARHVDPAQRTDADGEPGSSGNWDSDPDPYIWDFGRTRVTQLNRNLAPGSNNSTYALAFQIPLAALDASARGGPKLHRYSVFSLGYATANSNTNPAQKDFICNGPYRFSDPNQPLCYGDPVTPSGPLPIRPVIPQISSSSCSTNVTLTAHVVGGTQTWGTNQLRTNIRAVTFEVYRDRNGNGLADDGESWSTLGTVTMDATPTSTTYSTSGSLTGGSARDNLGPWNAQWNPNNLARGQYIIRASALDSRTAAPPTTLSTDTDPLSPTYNPATRTGDTTYEPVVGYFVNNCSTTPPPSVSKSANPSQVVAGEPVQFTITVTNPLASSLTVSQIEDLLPTGFSYVSTGSGTLGSPTTAPNPGATGTLVWTFSPPVSIPAASSGTLVFTANAANTVGTYNNIARTTTSEGTVTSPPVPIAVGAPRLAISKAASLASANPGDTITYTITYSNPSTVNVSNATISDTLPQGLSYVANSATAGGSYNAGTRTLTWTVASLEPSSDPFSVSFQVTVDNPYPSAAPVTAVNTATITSPQTTPASASVSTFINAPRPNFILHKTSTVSQITAGNQITFSITYENIGNVGATNVVLTDPVPAGFTFVAATGGGAHAGGVVTWNLNSVAAGGSGTVTVTMQAATPFNATNPQTNTATLAWGPVPQQTVSASYSVGVLPASGGACPQAPTIYYFRSTQQSITNFGNQYVATLANETPETTVGTTLNIPLYFYQEPATGFSSGANVSTTFSVSRLSTGNTSYSMALHYHVPGGTLTQVGLAEPGTMTGQTLTNQHTFSRPLPINLPANARLVWAITTTAVGGGGGSALVRVGGNTSPSQGNACTPTPARPVLDKIVDRISAVPGDNLIYTLRFSNAGGTDMTGSEITDVLPAGVSFQSATLNGSPVTPTNISGQTYRFSVRSSDTATAGQVTAGQSGTLVINARVTIPLAAGINLLDNVGTLSSTGLSSVEARARTFIRRPNTSVSKQATPTLLYAGNTVTYTVNALNSGDATATGVTLTDVLPVAPYFNYVANSVTISGLGGAIASFDSGTNTLTVSGGTLAAGAAATVTYQMQVASAASGLVPAGLTDRVNTVQLSDAQTAGTRTATATVSISGNPNLTITKAADPSPASPIPGGFITYQLVVTNNGTSTADGVVVRDPIPANTVYHQGSLFVNGVANTDGADADAGRFDAFGNQVVFELGQIPPGESRSLSFRVRINSPLTQGSTSIPNTATVSAANAPSRQASVTVTATAEPIFAISKSALDSFPYPYAVVVSQTGPRLLTVQPGHTLVAGEDVRLGVAGTVAQVVLATNTTVELNTDVTAPAGTELIPLVRYTLSYVNSGNAPAPTVTVTDTLPAGITFVSATPAPTTVSGQNLTWSLGSLGVGERGSISILVQPAGPGVYDNTAAINGTPSNTVRTQVGTLQLSKVTTTPQVNQGTTATYTITLSNPRPDTAANVVIQDFLPPNFFFATTDTITASAGVTRTSTQEPAVNDTQPIWGTWSLPGGSSLAITFTVTVAPNAVPGVYDNDVQATSSLPIAPFFSDATTAEDVEVLGTGTGFTLSGSVYHDLQPDFVKTEGELWDGPTVFMKRTAFVDGACVAPANAVVQIDASADPLTSGAFSFTGLAAGAYCLILNGNADPADITPAAPAGWLFTNPLAGLLQVTLSANMANQNFGLFHGIAVSGTVFFDDALGGGTASDAFRNGSEAGVAGVVVTLTDGVTTRLSTTAGDGLYADLYMAVPLAASSVQVTLSHPLRPVSGYNDGTTATRVTTFAEATSATSPGAVITQTLTSGLRYSYHFGVLRQSRLAPDSSGQTTSPGTITYTHLFRPGNLGVVSSSMSGAYVYNLLLDADCSGEIDATEGNPVTGFNVTDAWPREADGSLKACAVALRVIVPSGVPVGQTDEALLGLNLAWQGLASVSDNRSVLDITTIIGGSSTSSLLAVRKAACNQNQTPGCPAYGSNTSGAPQEIIEYRIHYRNQGTTPITDVVLNDPVPFFSSLITSNADFSNQALELTCPNGTKVYLPGSGSSITANVNTACNITSLGAGQEGYLRFRVRIN